MSPLENVLSRLECTRQGPSGWKARCPAHPDRSPSLSITQNDKGRVLLHCFAGCPFDSILQALGLTRSDLIDRSFEDSMTHFSPLSTKTDKHLQGYLTIDDAMDALAQGLGEPSDIWTYQNAQGLCVGWVVRWNEFDGKKTFRPISLVNGMWRHCGMPVERPLYRLPELERAKMVIITEGEKAADAARGIGFVATTSSGGSSAAHQTSWKPLAGKQVVIVPDNDEAGDAYAENVVELLNTLSPRPTIRIVNLPNLPEKGDIVDWIEDHGEAAEPMTLHENLQKLINQTKVMNLETEEVSLSFCPFPVEILPNPLADYIKAGAKSIMCDPTYIAFPLLTALGAAIGNKFRLELKSEWHVPPILWTMIIGRSGTSKTPAFNFALREVYNRQNSSHHQHEAAREAHEIASQEYDKAFAQWEKSKSDAAPPEEPKAPKLMRYFVCDTTMEAIGKILHENPNGVLLCRDELSGFFSNMDRYASKKGGGGDSANLLSMYNATTATIDRKTATEPMFIERAALSITGGIQPEVLSRSLGKEHQESGMAARFLFAFPNPVERVWKRTEETKPDHNAIRLLFESFYDFPQQYDEAGKLDPIVIGLTPEAEAVWESYYNAHNQELAEKEGAIAAAWSKLEEYPARLALILHFVRLAANDPRLTNPNKVDARTLQHAIQIIHWCKHETERVYALLKGELQGPNHDQQRLIEFIKRKGGTVTKRQIQQGCRWFRTDPKAIQTQLNAFVEQGVGVWKKVGKSTTFVLNPETPNTIVEEVASVGVVDDVDRVDEKKLDPLKPLKKLPRAVIDLQGLK